MPDEVKPADHTVATADDLEGLYGEPSALPSAGQMLADHIGQGESGEQQEAVYQKGMRERLY